MSPRDEAVAFWIGRDGHWSGSNEAIAEKEHRLTAADALHAAENILGAIGRNEIVEIHGYNAVIAVAGLRKLAKLMPVRPDDSGLYSDDDTLLQIVADSFAWHVDPVTRRDAAWLVSLAREALYNRKSQQSRNALNCGEKSP